MSAQGSARHLACFGRRRQFRAIGHATIASHDCRLTPPGRRHFSLTPFRRAAEFQHAIIIPSRQGFRPPGPAALPLFRAPPSQFYSAHCYRARRRAMKYHYSTIIAPDDRSRICFSPAITHAVMVIAGRLLQPWSPLFPRFYRPSQPLDLSVLPS